MARSLPLEMFEQLLKYAPELFEYGRKLSPEFEGSVISALTT